MEEEEEQARGESSWLQLGSRDARARGEGRALATLADRTARIVREVSAYPIGLAL